MRDTYRPEIDGLRAVAILPVVIYHADFSFWSFDPFQGGYIGVDVFFVISGYLIASLVLREVYAGSFTFYRFYARRVRRLFPALLAVLSTVFLLGYLFFFRIEAESLAKHLLSSVLFVQNITLVREIGYFDNAAESVPLLHLWSLSVEEQFYLVFPPLLLMIWRWWPRYLAHGLIVLLLVSLIAAQVGSTRFPDSTFYLLPTRGWELLVGVLLAKLELDRGRRPDRRLAGVLGPLGILMIIAANVGFSDSTPHPSLITLVPVVGTALVIWYCTGSDATSRILCNRVMRGIGLISYPLYLWHAVFFTFAIIFLGGQEQFSDALKAFCILLSLMVSWGTYQWIERPLRFRFPVGLSLRVLSVWTLIVLGLSALSWQQQGVLPGSYADATRHIDRQFEGALWQYTKNTRCMERYPVAGSENWNWFFCYLSEPKPPEILLIGSSFANQYVPLAKTVFPGASVLSFGTCDLVKKLRGPITPSKAPCSGDGAQVQARVIDEALLPSETVRLIVADLLVGPEDFNALLGRRLEEIRQRTNVPIVLMLPHARPEWKEIDTKSCFGRPVFGAVADGCKRTYRSLKSPASSEQVQGFMAIAKRFERVYVFDPNPSYCTDGVCHFTRGGLPVFRDPYHHLSEHGNSLIADRFRAFLERKAIE